jgi:hypothetical protein
LVDDDEHDRGAVGDPLHGRSRDDLSDADPAVGDDVLPEVLPPQGGERLGEAGVPEGEDPVDVGLDPPEVEGRGGEGEVVGDGDRGRRRLGEPARGERVGLDPDDAGEQEPEEGGDQGVGEAAHDGSVGRRWRRPPWIAVGVLAIVALLLTGTRLLVGPLPVEDREEVLALSERFAVALASYDHEDLEGQAEEIRGMSTGEFLGDYEATFGSEAFGDAMRQTRSNASATVTDGPLLVSLEETSARSLTVLQQSIQAEELDEPDERRLQVELTLSRTPEGWRVDGVEIH